MFVIIIILVIVFAIIISVAQISTNKEKVSNSASSNASYMQDTGFCNDAEFGYDDLGFGNSAHVYVDNHNKKLMLVNGITNQRLVLNFKDILGMEFQEDGVHTNGVGRAVVGGALFGGAGAVVGAVTGKRTVQNIKIIMYINDVLNPRAEINFKHSSKIKCDSLTYKNIMNFENRLDATVRAIIANNENAQVESVQPSSQGNITAEAPKANLNLEEKNIENVDYFLMYTVNRSNPGRASLKGKWILNGLAINYSNVIGRQIDLYTEGLEYITTVTVDNFSDFSVAVRNTIALHINDFSGEGLPKIAFAVEAGKDISETICDRAANGYYTNSYSM